MGKVISIGKQDFASLRENNYFFIDKTKFIKEWWDNADDITLIARPRRFGKTLNMSMLDCFFSTTCSDRGDLFEGLSVWEDERYRKLQGTYPVIFLSFADVKANNYKDARTSIFLIINEVYQNFRFITETDALSDEEKSFFPLMNAHAKGLIKEEVSDALIYRSLKDLCNYMTRYFGKKTIILLDEYDTPVQEAYLYGYYSEFISFIRNLFNSTFKTNPYLERAVMTGITRVSKESIFSDLNNLRVVTTTSDMYADCFGFTEEEVFAALDDFDMGDRKEIVKKWYDGFTFGEHRDIYNPWSITNYLKEKKLRPYWASTSSNGLVGQLIRTASSDVKEKMEDLLNNREIAVGFDEQIVFNQLDSNENAIWSLLLASGYLKVEDIDYYGITLEPLYKLKITNLETISMFSNMFRSWFENSEASYGRFVKSLMQGDIDAMNYYMKRMALATFSYFDVGNGNDESEEPERFYHGFVLGIMADQAENYEIRSNRESGFGRYDIMMIPHDYTKYYAIIIEFKVCSRSKKESLEDTVHSALKQIEDKNYDAELISLGIPKERIRHYGFAFEGKKVLIGDKI